MKRREPLNPDITPLIDVVFILLVFFIVTSTFKKDEMSGYGNPCLRPLFD